MTTLVLIIYVDCVLVLMEIGDFGRVSQQINRHDHNKMNKMDKILLIFNTFFPPDTFAPNRFYLHFEE